MANSIIKIKLYIIKTCVNSVKTGPTEAKYIYFDLCNKQIFKNVPLFSN